MPQKSKLVCILDSNNFFEKISTIYFDKRLGDFPNYGHEIQPPDLKKVHGNSEVRAKWNSDSQTWSYIKETQEEVQDEVSDEVSQTSSIQDPMYFLRIIRDIKLLESDELILQLRKNKKEAPKKLKEYREKLRDIPNKIESKEIAMPKLADRTLVKNFADPANFIIFDWPELPKLEEL